MAVSAIQAIARSTPWFRGKYRLFRGLYRMCSVPENRDFRLRMQGTTTPVCVRLESLLESRIMCLGDYEPASSRLIDRVVRPGWNCLDVGANVGLVTVRLAERVGPTGRVLAIEANPALMPRLMVNTEGLTCVIRVGVAVGAEPGEGFLAVNDPSVCANHNATMVGARPEDGAVRVSVNSLDQLWGEVLRKAAIQFMKLDIEGYEFNALQGAGNLLAACRPNILMEFNRPYASAMGYTLDDVLEFLRRFGPYQVYGIGSSGRPCVLSSTTAELIDVFFQVA
jgi:FkbM family methyltransferase